MDIAGLSQESLAEILIKLAGSLTEEDLMDPATFGLANQLVQMLDPKADPIPQELVDQLKNIKDKATRFKMAAQAIGANRPDLMEKLVDSMKAAGLWKSEGQKNLPIFQQLDHRRRKILFAHHDAEADAAHGNPALNKAMANPAAPAAPHNDHIRSVADSYAASKGMKLQHELPKVKVNPEFASKVASAYQGMDHSPAHPETKAAYDALIDETTQQLHHLQRSGYKFTAIKPGQTNPYASGSAALNADLRDNKHAHYYPTDQGFGSTDSMHPDHPMLRTVKDLHGNEMPANDAFRIVHDVFGHAKEGHSFGPNGEEAAYRHHSQMFSPLARRALTAETRGQNSWVNFGPHAAHNRANPEKTIFADQKAGLLPEWAEEHYSNDMKKAEDLNKAEDHHLVHYSHKDTKFDTLDPNFHGTGVSGDERKRYGRPNRTNYYDAGTKPEDKVAGPAKFKYVIKAPSKILDLNTKEAEPFKEAAKTSAGIVDHTELEHHVKNAGYDGYRHSGSALPNAVALFHPQKPIEVHDLTANPEKRSNLTKGLKPGTILGGHGGSAAYNLSHHLVFPVSIGGNTQDPYDKNLQPYHMKVTRLSGSSMGAHPPLNEDGIQKLVDTHELNPPSGFSIRPHSVMDKTGNTHYYLLLDNVGKNVHEASQAMKASHESKQFTPAIKVSKRIHDKVKYLGHTAESLGIKFHPAEHWGLPATEQHLNANKIDPKAIVPIRKRFLTDHTYTPTPPEFRGFDEDFNWNIGDSAKIDSSDTEELGVLNQNNLTSNKTLNESEKISQTVRTAVKKSERLESLSKSIQKIIEKSYQGESLVSDKFDDILKKAQELIDNLAKSGKEDEAIILAEALEKGKNRREQQAKVFGGWKTSPDSPRRAKQMAALEEQGKRRYGLETEKAPGKPNASGKIIDKPTFDNPGNKIQHIGNPDSLVHEHAHLEVEKQGSGLKQMQADMDHEWGAQNKKYGYKQQARAKDEYSTTALENPLRRRAGLPAHQKETKEKNPKRDYAADVPGKKITQEIPGGKKLTGTSSNRTSEHNRRMDQVDRGELKFDADKGWQPGTGVNSKINQRARSIAENPANAGRKDAKTLMRGEDGSKPMSFNDMKKADLAKSWEIKLKGQDGYHPVRDVVDQGHGKQNAYILHDGTKVDHERIEDLRIGSKNAKDTPRNTGPSPIKPKQ